MCEGDDTFLKFFRMFMICYLIIAFLLLWSVSDINLLKLLLNYAFNLLFRCIDFAVWFVQLFVVEPISLE